MTLVVMILMVVLIPPMVFCSSSLNTDECVKEQIVKARKQAIYNALLFVLPVSVMLTYYYL